jgi:hypothetical protein
METTFENVRIGDRVFDLKFGWGEVTDMREGLFLARFDNRSGSWYTKEGIAGGLHHDFGCPYQRTLYWQPVSITPPERPKRKVKKWRWVSGNIISETDLFVSSRHYANQEEFKLYELSSQIPIQRIDSTEMEVEE